MPTFDRLHPDVIRVDSRLRALDAQAVTRLADSIGRIGLQTPISVRWCAEENADYAADLIAGLHRLEACKQLGLTSVPVAIHDGDDTAVRLWEIAENLHRAELTALERDEHIAEWLRLTKLVQSEPLSKKGGRGNTGGRRAAAREIGVSPRDAVQAERVAAMAPEAKAAAREAGIDDNHAALERVAHAPSAAAQVAAVLREKDAADARKANRDTDRIVLERRIDGIKEWLAARLDVNEMATLGEMMAGICDQVSKALLREVV